MSKILVFVMFLVLGTGASVPNDAEYDYTDDFGNSEELILTSEDAVITYMKSVAGKLDENGKKRSLENYKKGLSSFFKVSVEELSKEQSRTIDSFGTAYLNARFKTEAELLSSFKKLMSSFDVADWCSGEWVGAPGWESLCEEPIYNILIDMCFVDCLNPYTAEDCIVLAPCGDLEPE